MSVRFTLASLLAAVALLWAALVTSVATAAADAPVPAGGALPVVRVVLHPKAVVAGSDYALGAIADLDGGDAATRTRLAALVVGTAPRQGYTDAVGRMQLAAEVRRLSGLADLVWEGADQIRIRGAGQRIALEALTDAAVRALHAEFAGQYTTIALRPVSTASGISVPAGKVQLDARVTTPQVLARRMSALVDVRVDGQFYTTVPVWFAVDATRPALVARAPLQPGATLRAEDFETKAVAVTAPGLSPALAASSSVDALRLRRGLEPGMALAVANVEQRPTIARAETVAVRVVQGAVTIETTGVALADARVGDTVKVQSAKSSEVFPARVVGPGVVMVTGR